jgi:PAS domain S-box-containing protein
VTDSAAAVRLHVWSSLRLRLPLLISLLVVIVVATFLGVAYREVRATLLQSATARAQGAADQLASLLAQSILQRFAEMDRMAEEPAVRELLQTPSDRAREAARGRLTALGGPSRQVVELWSTADQLVLSVSTLDSAAGELPRGTAPVAAGFGAFRAYRGVVYSEAATEIPFEPRQAHVASSPKRLGYLVVRRQISAASTGDLFNRLVGRGAAVAMGNKNGDVWTDMSKVVPAPAVDLTRAGVTEYRGADGQRRLGALAEIRGAPWMVWVEFQEAVVLGPAQTFLKRMVAIALIFLTVAAAVASMLSARITTPLSELTAASEALASGEYSRRVTMVRHDEIGRLGMAFNAMSEQVDAAHQKLEERVQLRTAGLAEAGRQLEQHVLELKEARAELDRFFSIALDLLCIADVDGSFKRVNPAWTTVLGWTAAELTSNPYLELVHPDDRPATEAEAARLAQGGTTVSFENRYRCRDGSYRWLNWKAASVPERGVIYAAARDVTEEKRTAQELGARVAELAVVNQELESFSYSVSHDLRAPLRHVTGFAALLRESVGSHLDPQQQRYLTTITEAASRMGRLIDDLLSFSRMGRTALIKQHVNLADLVDDARREVAADSAGREIVWTIAALPEVEADPAMLRLAMVNLLSNAVKYTATRAPAQIEVGTDGHQNGEITVFVRDNGVGFDMQYVDKLFGVFQRLHSSDEFDGTGIGLANVRRIIHRHQGRVWAEAAVDRGATFYFSLPTQDGADDD